VAWRKDSGIAGVFPNQVTLIKDNIPKVIISSFLIFISTGCPKNK
jgi:hypothetical protein